MTIYPTLLVDSPPIQPYRYGLESVAVPQPTGDPHWQAGVEYEPISVYDDDVWPGACWVGSISSNNLPAGAATELGLPFVVYGGVTCKAVGYTEAEMLAKALAIFKLGWQTAAEKALWTGVAGNVPFLTSAANVAGTGVSMTAAVALLEDYMGGNYAGNAVIHAPRKAGAYLADRKQLFERNGPQGPQLQSALGSQFCFGGGYPNTAPGGGAAAANTLWLYASGVVGVWRGEPVNHGGLAGAINKTTNDTVLFYEQPTVLTLDGPLVAVSVDLTK